jgi:hypothetical protein
LPEFLGLTGIEWTRRYIAAGGEYDALGIHAYTSPNGNAATTIGVIKDFLAAFPNKRVCATELGTFNNSAVTFAELLEFVENNFSCWFVYTDVDPSGTVYSTGVSLVDSSGALTKYGEIYAKR